MRFIYNFLFSIGFALSAPYYFMRLYRRGNWREGFYQRFGTFEPRIKQALTNRQTLWIHAVSVGEVNICTQLIKALEPRVPNLKIVVSTTTTTGMGELKKKLPRHITLIYYPIDARKYVCRAIATIAPKAVVLVEAEIWPNFIWRLMERNTPLFLVNARLSERSFRGYRRYRFFFRRFFNAFTGVGAQNETDAAKLLELGCQPDAVRVVGSLKYDAAVLDERHPLDIPGILRQLGVPTDATILLGGSTHDGEEAVLAEVFSRLRPSHPNLFLILVPRHFERGRQVGRELEAHGLKFAYRSEVNARTQHQAGEIDCLLVNTTGELRRFYEFASVIFVGKSLTASGGQNPIEPAALGKPIIFGPHMENFAPIAKAFVSEGGACQVANAGELEKAIGGLLSDPARAEEMGRCAQKVVRDNRGSIDRTVDMIVEQLRDADLYVVEKV
jgi:3-deoxy-D-manno-octulosonic-acid transferase